MRKPTVKRFSWSTPNRYSVDAEVVGQWLDGLPDYRPETIVQAAADPGSPAHQLFDWDDGNAAHQHRLTQARVMYAHLVIEVITYSERKPTTHSVRAILRTSATGDYDKFEDAFSQPAKRNFVLQQALQQLANLKRRYSTLSELSVVFAAYDQVAAKHPQKGRRR